MKGKRLLTIFLSTVIVLVLTLLLASACAAPTPTPTPTPAPTPTPSPSPSPTPAPTPAAQVHEWKMQSMYSPGQPMYDEVGVMLDNIRIATEGRLDITQFAAASVVPTAEIFTALSGGVIQMGFASEAYIEDVVPVGRQHSQNLPAFPSWTHQDYYYQELGYQDLMREAFAEHNAYWVYAFGGSAGYGSQMSTVPIRTLSDYEGKKVRTAGLLANIFEHYGATTFWVPGEEIYLALATGTADLCTWGSPAHFDQFSLHEVTKYFITPAPSSYGADGLWLNLEAWDALSEGDQIIFYSIVYETNAKLRRVFEYNDVIVLNKWVDEFGFEVITLPPEDVRDRNRLIQTFWDDQMGEDPLLDEAITIMRDYYEFLGLV